MRAIMCVCVCYYGKAAYKNAYLMQLLHRHHQNWFAFVARGPFRKKLSKKND